MFPLSISAYPCWVVISSPNPNNEDSLAAQQMISIWSRAVSSLRMGESDSSMGNYGKALGQLLLVNVLDLTFANANMEANASLEFLQRKMLLFHLGLKFRFGMIVLCAHIRLR